jgi:outer membrane protein assembly factor BamB
MMKPAPLRSVFIAASVVGFSMAGSALFATAGAGATPNPPSTAVCDAVAHHQDASHSGYSCASLPTAPSELWSTTLNGFASYPIIADGMVFVVTEGTNSGDWLYALHGTTGQVAWGPVPLSSTYSWAALAYDNGMVFTNNFNGTVTAFNALTGAQVWARVTAYFSGEPVAYDGVVYLQGPGNVFALSEQTGAILWQTQQLDGDGSSVSVDGTGVYLAAGCSWYDLSPGSGDVVWRGDDGCSGGGGGTTYLADGLDFETVDNLVLNASTGADVGTFSGTPAFSGSDGYFATGSAIFAEDVSTLTPIFTATLPSQVVTSPVVAGDVVYVGTADAMVYGVSTTSGQIVWSHSLPSAPGGGGQYSSPVSDIGVGDGELVVPTGDAVTAFGGLQSPTTTAVSSSSNPATYGSAVTITASVSPTDGAGTVEFSADGSTISGCGGQVLALVGGVDEATCMTSALSGGNHSVVATYSGDTGYAGSADTLTETVNGSIPPSETPEAPLAIGLPLAAMIPFASGIAIARRRKSKRSSAG